jgi:hypothetical protein
VHPQWREAERLHEELMAHYRIMEWQAAGFFIFFAVLTWVWVILAAAEDGWVCAAYLGVVAFNLRAAYKQIEWYRETNKDKKKQAAEYEEARRMYGG